MTKVSLNTKLVGFSFKLYIKRYYSSKIERISSLPSKDIQIPVPWGYISAKQWGTPNGKPVFGIHSIQDNAGTFDTLAPLLPKHWNFTCIDLPGHGLSDHFERGHIYYLWDFITAVLRVAVFLKWNRFDFIGHGGGAEIGLIYASLFPESINHLISLDVIKKYSLASTDPKLQNAMATFYDIQMKSEGKFEAPIYTTEEAVKEMVKKRNEQVIDKSVKVLLKRGSKILPDGKVVISADSRIELPFPGTTLVCTEQFKKLIEYMRCQLMIIKAKKGISNEKKDVYEDFKGMYKKYCLNYQYIEVEGKHYVHLDDPQCVSESIIDYIEGDNIIVRFIEKLLY